VQTNQSTLANYKSSDFQTAKANGIAFTMAHRMGLAVINVSSITPYKRYSLPNNANFNWVETAETTTASPSDSYSSTAIPYKSGTTHYYLAKRDESTSFATIATQTGLDSNMQSANNAWSTSVSINSGKAQTVSPSISIYAVDQTWTLEVGDILFNNRSLSRRRNKNSTATTIFNAKVSAGQTPVAIVFATSSTVTMPAYDQQSSQNGVGNFTHGYAMALKRKVNGGVAWSTSNVVENASGTRTMTNLSDFNAIVSDMNGFKYSKTIRNKYASISACVTGHPAVGNALSYTASGQTSSFTQQTSGWYLPSAGQMYQWMKVFGNTTTMGSNPTLSGNYYCSWPNCGTIASNINSYLTGALGSASYYDSFADQQWIWTVSEHSASYAWEIAFDGVLYIYGYQKQQLRRVRCAIAF